MNEKDEEYAESRDQDSNYFPIISNRGYDVLLLNNILQRYHRKTYKELQSHFQIIFVLRLMH